MWLERVALIFALISGLFALDILLWTFSIPVPFAPLDALLRLGIWLLPLSGLVYYIRRKPKQPQSTEAAP